MGDVEFIVAPGQTYAARELSETLAFELERQDMPATVTLGSFPELGAVGELPPVYVIVDPHRYVEESGSGLPEPALLRRTIAVWTDGPPAADDELVRGLRWSGAVFATSQRSVAALHRGGIKARLLRAGYSAYLDRFDPAASRSIDALFLGVATPRRTRLLEHAAAVLDGCHLHVETGAASPRADEPAAPLAAPRWDLLARAEILLSLHAGEDHAIEWPAVLDAIHAGAVVVSEHASAIAPLVPGEQLVVASPEAVPHVARALLRDPARLAAIRGAAHERLRDWIPYALWASILRAAVVELIGEPLAARTLPSYGAALF